MLRILIKSKIQPIIITDKNLHYEGSITIDEEILTKADILEGELVQVININNGERFETYAMKGEKGSGACCLNGGTARLGEIGDKLIVISYGLLDTVTARSLEPKRILVDDKNRLLSNNR